MPDIRDSVPSSKRGPGTNTGQLVDEVDRVEFDGDRAATPDLLEAVAGAAIREQLKLVASRVAVSEH